MLEPSGGRREDGGGAGYGRDEGKLDAGSVAASTEATSGPRSVVIAAKSQSMPNDLTRRGLLDSRALERSRRRNRFLRTAHAACDAGRNGRVDLGVTLPARLASA
jgi:hypothetical protein